ncbi:acyl-CoA synthetase [Pseudorhodoferax sp.]|uniref:acyl-CoA synthetase n=1 Tax=Pseudorhodoferax sp. TaxID=1993553 RepID=UPI002DD686F2|nr:long-chain fatty acid--CoA ligase [Pseudorhodoferax sp.]
MRQTQSLHRAVQQYPDRVATVFNGRRQTFRQLHERVARLAGALQALGMRAGDRVGMLALNSDRTLEFYLAVWWGGGVVNPVNTRWSAAEIAFSLQDCETAILFVDDAFVPMVPELRAQAPCLQTLLYVGEQPVPAGFLGAEQALAAAAPVPDALRSGDDLAGVFYTGGTTGRPKGVMLSQEALATNALLSLVASPLDRDAVLLHSAPLFHLAGLSALMRSLVMGTKNVFLPGFTPGGVLRAVAEERVTNLMLIPVMLQFLLDDPAARTADLSSVRVVGYGASPISEALLERAFGLLPQADFVQGYGMTELAAGVTYLTAEYHSAAGRKLGKLGSAGRALNGVDLRIVDADGRELPRGQVGEIAVRSPCAMSGYWNLPETTAQALRDGWMHTGDAARMDEDGFVFVVDRFKDMVVSGGENVYCGEVEAALTRHPAVAAAAVIGVPHAQWGEAVHAVLVLRPGTTATAEDIQAHCKTLIAGYKCPRSVEFMAALPISGAGKVMKYKLREPHWKERQRGVA